MSKPEPAPPRAARLSGVLALCMALAACDGEPVITQICTLIGCGDSLTVVLDPPVPLPYRARVTFPAGQNVAFLCTSAGVSERTGDTVLQPSCEAGRFQITCGRAPDFCSASPVEVEVRPSGGGVRAGRLTPAYTILQPNGPDCGPTCRAGSAALP